MTTISPEEARAKFGELEHKPTRTYCEFDEPTGGIWRPVYMEGVLVNYRLYKLHRLTKKLPRWRSKAR